MAGTQRMAPGSGSVAPPDRPVAPGEALFARYAFPPNELGHCGPAGAQALLAGGAGDGGATAVRQRAPQFDGAWPYLRLLADAVGGVDPLGEPVVRAYWLGGEPAHRVDAAALRAGVEAEFGTQPGVLQRLAAGPSALAAGASHTFHVFVVYPWVGLLGAGGDAARRVLDSCRVRWGRVEAVDGETAVVRARPLSWDGRRLGLGSPRAETCRWARGGHAFVPGLRPGALVALHWDWVCDALHPDEAARLAAGTRAQLASTNAWLAGRAAGDGRAAAGAGAS